MKRKNPNPTSAENTSAVKSISQKCLKYQFCVLAGLKLHPSDEPDWALVASTTHPGPLAQSEPQRGNQDLCAWTTSSSSWLLLLRPGGALSTSVAQPLQAQARCPPVPSCAPSAGSGALPAQTTPEAGIAAALLWAPLSPTDTIHYFRLSGFFCGAACAGGTGLTQTWK